MLHPNIWHYLAKANSPKYSVIANMAAVWRGHIEQQFAHPYRRLRFNPAASIRTISIPPPTWQDASSANHPSNCQDEKDEPPHAVNNLLKTLSGTWNNNTATKRMEEGPEYGRPWLEASSGFGSFWAKAFGRQFDWLWLRMCGLSAMEARTVQTGCCLFCLDCLCDGAW